MTRPAWTEEFPAAITICDADGVIVDLNQRSARTFEKEGGRALIGTSLYGCHPPQAQEQIRGLMQSRQPNAYTIEKNGVKKLIYQAPWYEQGHFKGLVELSIVIPFELPHFKRS
jgi:hypothetical protein